MSTETQLGASISQRLWNWALAPERLWRRASPWAWAMAVAIGLYVLYFTQKSLSAHYGLGTSAYDYGLYDQGVWLLSRFKAPFVTLMGRNLLGDHTSFILLFLVPFYWIAPGAETLLLAQSAAIGLAAAPVYLLAKHLLRNGPLAFLLGVSLLLHPATGWTNMENFHPDGFLALFIAFAIYAAVTEKWRMYAVFVVLALLVKEDVAFLTVPLGVWVALRRNRRIGVFTIVGSLSYMAFAFLVVMRSLLGVPTLNLWRIPFGGFNGLVREAIRMPGNVVTYLLSEDRPWYVWQMTAPTALVFLRRLDVALIGILLLASNLISTFEPQRQIFFHYSIALVPVLVMGTVWAVSAIRRDRQVWAAAAIIFMALWTGFLWGTLPWSRSPYVAWTPDYPVAVAGREIIADIPADAVVSAQHALTPHLAHREQIYMFPNPFYRILYGTDVSLEGSRLPAADEVEYVVLPFNRSPDDPASALLEYWEPEKDAFELVESNQYWALYRRK